MMKQRLASLLILSLLYFTNSLVLAQVDLGEAYQLKGSNLNYLVSTPDGYEANGTSTYPMILFLHGGDRSNTKHHPKKYAEQAGLKFPFIVVAPHCSSGCNWASVDYDALVSEVLQGFKVDQERIYITGYSMGGYGTWSALTKSPNWFAAAAPIAGGGNANTICNAKEISIRAYHGDKDNVISHSRSKELIDKLKSCDANAELFTIPGGGHGIWPRLFQDQRFYDWLLSHSK